ncbi:SPX domain-containing protein 4 isoform X2 [Elaeis guineensis]|uniref:SPX domain-containing protein 4 isoform X2 n=1 Tax=Elaeis guineensis var. tenera TaxID=51953 RepID=A0A6I9QHU6_ELAGV|nr:SPX domain-containing protein 4 isoform X2 [Elaeis guineensis]
MKFGKDFRNHLEDTLPDWRDKFLCYKPLKKLIKHIPPDPVDAGAQGPWVGLEEWFVRILNEELDKFNDFYVDKEEDFVIRLQELKERIERVRASKNKAFASESEFSEEMLEIRKAFVTIHGEMVLLKNYSSLNFAGLVKILKKYDKRTGGLLSLPFTQRALHQPFFTTEPLTRLVHECEANLELLFPLEAEVIESGSPEKMETSNGMCNLEASSVQEDTMDVYRSTLAAMKAIKGLRRASSTYNPLSLAQFFHGEDGDDGSGAVTAENSASNSLTTSQNQDVDQESVHSGD